MKIELDLFEMLGDMMESVGVPKPNIVTGSQTPGRYSVLLEFDGSNMPYPLVEAGSFLQNKFYGKDCRSKEFAVHNAMMCLVDQLKKTYAIEIHDISYLKMKDCESNCLKVFEAMGHFKTHFCVFLNKYENSMDEVQSIIAAATEKHGDVLDDVVSELDEIVQKSIIVLQNSRQKNLNIGCELDDYHYRIAANAKKNPLLATEIVWNISQKKVLNKILDYFGLLHAKYSSEITDGDLFIGECKVNFGKCYGDGTSGRTKVKGELKKTPQEAECSAAVETILFIERKQRIEIVDFNYENMMHRKEMLCAAIEKRSRLDELFAETNKSWGGFISTVEEFINNQYGLSQAVSLSGEESAEWTARMDLMCELEKGVSLIKEMYYLAVSTMASKID